MTSHIARAQVLEPRPARLVTTPAALASVLADAAHFPDGHTSALALPTDIAEVAWVLQNHATVLPIGSQTSLTGGATPRGEVVMALRELRGIDQISSDRWRVGAGVTLAEFQAHLARNDAFFPPVPAYAGAQIGGAASTNAAGPATFKYGSTRRWIEGLTVVLADGAMLELQRGQCRAHPDGFFELARPGGGRRVPIPAYHLPQVAKVSAGYYAAPEMDLIDLFLGSEGTLGVITHVVARVVSPAPRIVLMLVTCPDEATALDLTRSLRLEAQQAWRGLASRPDISAIEYLDGPSLDLLRLGAAESVLPEAARAALIIQRELTSPAADAQAAGCLAALLRDARAEIVLAALPGDVVTARRILDLRAGVPLAVNEIIGRAQRDVDAHISKVAADMIVPFDRLADMVHMFREEFERLGLPHAVWGHISDGNLHPNAIPRSLAEADAGQAAILRLGRIVTAMGGSPLAEHGVGRNPTKQALLRQLYGDAGIEQMRAVKAALDPEARLAPGVMFPAA